MTEAIPPAAAPAVAEPEGDECSVCVAVHVRPLIDSELQEGCDALLTTTPQQPQVCVGRSAAQTRHLVQTAPNLLSTFIAQVITGAHSFTYDHVFGADSTPPDQLYGHCVEPLVSGLFKGYNATGVGVSCCMYCAECLCSKQADFCDIMGGASCIRTGISTRQEPPLTEGGMLVCSVCIRSDWIRQDLYHGKCFHSWW